MYALVTGASKGLGKAFARLLASKKYNLILVSRNKNLLEELKDELTKHDIDILVHQADLSIEEDCYKLFDSIKSYKVKLFINNAGFGNIGYFSSTDLNKEINMIDLNIKSVHILTKLYIQNFESGTVLNIGSLAGILPTPIHATYSATKAYINNFTRAINFELKKNNKNVIVLLAAPGPIKTEFNKSANSSSNKGMNSERCVKIIYRGVIKRKELIIPGFTMKLLFLFSRFIPTKLLMSLSHKIQSRK